MNILTIDTASKLEIIAIASGKRSINASRYVNNSHASTIFNSLDSGFKDLGISIKDVSLIGVGQGPGSFTGIRIAITTARMIAQVLNIPLVGIASHLIFAASLDLKQRHNTLIAFDAKKERVFAALYITDNTGIPRELVPPGDYPIRHILKYIDPSFPACGIGDGVEKYFAEIKSALPDLEFYDQYIPSAEKISSLTAALYEKNMKLYRDFKTVLPDYARRSDAELIKRNIIS